MSDVTGRGTGGRAPVSSTTSATGTTTGARLGRGTSAGRCSSRACSARSAWAGRRSSKIMPMLLFAVMLHARRSSSPSSPSVTGDDELPADYTSYVLNLQVVVAIFVASQAPASVSRDLRFRVVSLYFSRPLQRIDYVVAKYAALTTALFVLIAVPLTIMFVGALLAELPIDEQVPDYLRSLAGAFARLPWCSPASAWSSPPSRRGAGSASPRSSRCCSCSPASRAPCRASPTTQGEDTVAGYAGLLSPFTLVDGVQARCSAPRVALPAEPPGHGRRHRLRSSRRSRSSPGASARCCCATGGCRSREHPRPGQGVPLVRQRRRGQRRHDDDRARRHRPARPQRRRQVDADPHDGRLPRAVVRHRHPRRRRRLAQRGDLPPHRAGARARGDVRRRHRLGVRARQRQAAPAARPGGRGPPGARDRRDDRRAGPRHLDVLQGHEAADQDGDRAGARPAGAAARRAVQRHGPAAAAAPDGPAARDGRGRPHGAVQLAHPRGGRADRRPHRGHGRRAARGVG